MAALPQKYMSTAENKWFENSNGWIKIHVHNQVHMHNNNNNFFLKSGWSRVQKGIV